MEFMVVAIRIIIQKKKGNQFEGSRCKGFPNLFTEFVILDENNCEYTPPITVAMGTRVCSKAPLALHYLNMKDQTRNLKIGRCDK